MKQYKLKPGQPAIEMVDGPLAGRKYVPRMTYTEIPKELADRFEEVVTPPPVPSDEQMPNQAVPESSQAPSKGGKKS
jgi:hypothetical protein